MTALQLPGRGLSELFPALPGEPLPKRIIDQQLLDRPGELCRIVGNKHMTPSRTEIPSMPIEVDTVGVPTMSA